MITSKFRNTWIEIDLDTIGYNIKQIRTKLHEKTNIIAVVKANAYGHGSIQVAKKALQSGASALAVAMLEEALVLRKAEISAPILVLGWVQPEYAKVAAEQDITLTFFQKEWLEQVNFKSLMKPLKLHMKWDTGMGRIGIRTEEELNEVIFKLRQMEKIHLTGIYTHFSTADEQGTDFFLKQNERFNQLLQAFQKKWPDSVSIHTGNSAAAIRFPEKMHHYIRFGISLYGQYPSKWMKSMQFISLKQAFSLHSTLVHVKKVKAGETIGYGNTYMLKQDGWVGTVPIGYGDGWNRKLQGFPVLIEGKRMPIIGRICMDQMMVLLDQAYPLETKVTLIGSQYKQMIGTEEVAEYLDTIPYEVTCMINERIPRFYRSVTGCKN